MKLLGNNYLFWPETATASTYSLLKGQTSMSESRSQPEIDLSDKTTTGYSVAAFGNQKLSLKVSGHADLPDASGYTRIETIANANGTIKGQVRKNGVSATSTDAVLEAVWYVSIGSKNYTKDGGVDYEINLSLAAAPTIDALA